MVQRLKIYSCQSVKILFVFFKKCCKNPTISKTFLKKNTVASYLHGNFKMKVGTSVIMQQIVKVNLCFVINCYIYSWYGKLKTNWFQSMCKRAEQELTLSQQNIYSLIDQIATRKIMAPWERLCPPFLHFCCSLLHISSHFLTELDWKFSFISKRCLKN